MTVLTTDVNDGLVFHSITVDTPDGEIHAFCVPETGTITIEVEEGPVTDLTLKAMRSGMNPSGISDLTPDLAERLGHALIESARLVRTGPAPHGNVVQLRR